MSSETQSRLKRIRMRSWRRGMREMDMILGRFADSNLGDLTPAQLDLYEVLLEEMDQDLYDWASGRVETPQRYQALMTRICPNGGQLPR